MSTEASPAPAASLDTAHLPDTVLHPTKSYRRKYRKIMVKFERKMRDSTGLFKDEQRLFDISQRLAEQTDQLMELLLELNSHPHVPPRLRYDLKHAHEQISLDKLDDIGDAMIGLRQFRQGVLSGDQEQTRYEWLENEIMETREFWPRRSYAKLVSGGTLERRTDEDAVESGSRLAGGFLSKSLEEQYLKSLDDYLENKASNPRAHAASNLGRPGAEKTAERDKQMQIKNPASVYNWLRTNHPQVFMDDEKPAKAAASRASKRSTAGTKAKNEPDYDEDGIATEPTSTAKGKRKRDDDTSFRPKGGHPRPAKKRKEDTGSGKRYKRTSVDISVA